MRTAFLFNDDQAHQLAQALPVALALAEGGGPPPVIAVTTAALAQEAERLAGAALARAGIRLVRLAPRRPHSALGLRLARDASAARPLIYGDNLDFFASFEALVVPECLSTLLRTRHGLSGTRLILCAAGLEDLPDLAQHVLLFDQILAPGAAARDWLVERLGVAPAQIAVIGDPRRDLAPPAPTLPWAAEDPRPLLLYSPSACARRSSWYGIGPDLLDWFAARATHRLIFAPDPALFAKPFAPSATPLRLCRPAAISDAAWRSPALHIDLDGAALSDGSLARAAHVLLGDSGPVITDFLANPRPCLFLNPRRLDAASEPGLRAWQAGRVIERLDQIGPALAAAETRHRLGQPRRQRALLAELVDPQPHPARRAAAAIRSAGARPARIRTATGLRAG